jgi:hypothetical protein
MKRITWQGLRRLLASAAVALILLAAPVAFAGVNRWTPTGPTGYWCTALAFDPHDLDRIYVAMSEGVQRSRDGGLSWSVVLPTPAQYFDSILKVDPQQPGIVYASAAVASLFRSSDAGDTWADVSLPAGPVTALAVDPTNSSNLVAANQSAAFRSTNRGNSWMGATASSMYSLLFAGQNSSVVYGADFSATYYWGTSNRPGSLYKSTDGGSTWTSHRSAFGFYRGALAVDPANPSILYAGSVGVYKSENSGSTWVQKLSTPNLVVTGIVVDPRDPDTLYASIFEGGVIRSLDRGESWSDFDRGLDDDLIVQLAIDSTGTRLLAGAWFGQVYGYQIYSGAWDLAASAGNETTLASVSPDGAILERFEGGGASIESSGYARDGTVVQAIAGAADLTWVLWSDDDGGTALQVLSALDESVFHRYAPVGDWRAVDVSASATRTAAILWTNPDGRSGIWRVDSYGIASGQATLGPYPGWTARRIAHGADGRPRLLWTHNDGRVGLSTIDGGQITTTYRFTPEPGWGARDLTVAIDGQARILMDGPDDQMALWSVSDSGVRTEGPIHASPSAGQSASRLSAGSDGLTRVLWTSPDGSGTVYLLGLDGALHGSFDLD